METCYICKKQIKPSGCGTGYGIDKNDNKVCYSCCAEQDKNDMRENGEITLYLTKHPTTNGCYCYEVTNWPGSLRLDAFVSHGKHNIAKTRTDAWFIFDGHRWHGIQYGDNSELCYCKRTKEVVK